MSDPDESRGAPRGGAAAAVIPVTNRLAARAASASQAPVPPTSPVTPTSSVTPTSTGQPAPPQRIAFNRIELGQILKVYGHKVAAGEWRDYAIDFHRDRAIFSIFRHTSEMPLYRIEKDPKNARKQGAYSVHAAGGMILKRGRDLEQVLRVFEKKRELRLV